MLSPAKGLIVALEGPASQSLRRVARNCGLQILEGTSAAEVFELLLRVRPRVLIVQLSRASDEGHKLIQLLESSRGERVVIAASTDHSEAIELAARYAGASFYVSETGPGLLDKVAEAVSLAHE